MAIIGKFSKRESGYEGMIETRLWIAAAIFVKVNKGNDKAPDYRVMSGRCEIGAAWSRTSEAGASYLSVLLDDPGFSGPIACRLHEAADGYDLVWQRA